MRSLPAPSLTSVTARLAAPLAALFLTLPALAATSTYRIDAVHSEVAFHVRHLLTKTHGAFPKFQGTIVVDEQDISKSAVDVTIDAASIDTHSEARDKHLRGADFFEVEKFPTITFKSTKVAEVAKGSLEVTGTFTLHGVARTIVLHVTSLGTGPGMRKGTTVAGFEGTVTFNRSDFGMKTYLPAVGDEVVVTLNVEAGKVQ
jgi:polyisoprenoid-binding protein YceI